ncbi:MAG: cysteine--tRNA ligase, partial [Deltaproteobacteria bacterium]|nr:cysteine--tRNA ligase [Deltaproteobacteria bacterium]
QDVLGVFDSNPKNYFDRLKTAHAKVHSVDTAFIEQKIEARRQARTAKNFKLGDEIRAELLKMGVEIKDRPDGTTEWHLK